MSPMEPVSNLNNIEQVESLPVPRLIARGEQGKIIHIQTASGIVPKDGESPERSITRCGRAFESVRVLEPNLKFVQDIINNNGFILCDTCAHDGAIEQVVEAYKRLKEREEFDRLSAEGLKSVRESRLRLLREFASIYDLNLLLEDRIEPALFVGRNNAIFEVRYITTDELRARVERLTNPDDKSQS